MNRLTACPSMIASLDFPLLQYNAAMCDLLVSESGRAAQRVVGKRNDATAYGECSPNTPWSTTAW